MSSRLRVLLVDPSLFTAPYDAALTEGLLAAGIDPTWAIRPTRGGDRDEIAEAHADRFFYRSSDRLTRWPASLRAIAKGIAHAWGLVSLLRRVRRSRPDVVHFQWAVVPALDALAIALLRRRCPVVLTVHDTSPFNGERASRWQSFAFDAPARQADRVIVHTQSARARLLARGISNAQLAVIPHGPLQLLAQPRAVVAQSTTDARYTFVAFGELKRYKGLDVLIEALALLPSARHATRVIIAGRPRMDLEPLLRRIAELKLGDCVEIRATRQSEQEMADLFAQADCFVFPYRQVDASGVYFLVRSLSRWMIASRVGIFAEDLQEGAQGTLVPPEDAPALAAALAHAVDQRPRPPALAPGEAWAAIGHATRALYSEAIARRQSPPPSASFARPRLGRRALLAAATANALLSSGAWLTHRGASTGGERVAAAATSAHLAPVPSAPGEVPMAPLGLDPSAGYRLIKNWDFRSGIRDADSLRAEFHTRYVYANGSLDRLNDEWSRYRDHDNHVFSADGLSLVARSLAQLAPGQIESGMLRSRWSGHYGVFEIRMQVPGGRGLWPAFWLNPEDQRWPPEIDVVEIVNNGRDDTRSSFHFLHGAGAGKAGRTSAELSQLNRQHAYEPGVDYSLRAHVFAVEWTPGRVRHLVDGVVIADREYRWVHDDGTDGGPAHVLVNLAVGGKWPGPPATGVLPARLNIAYIRVWQREP
ncbi:MAG: hypothetical protein RL033_5380 [Pseudomonadota bacterium]